MKNIYHRYINLPFELKTPEVIKNSPKNPVYIDDNPYDHFDENLYKWLRRYHLNVEAYESLYTPPHSYVPLHIDGHNQGKELMKLNLSYGAKESTMRWYKSDKLVEQTDKNSTQYHEKDVKLQDLNLYDDYRVVDHIDPGVKIESGTDYDFGFVTASLSDATLIYEANTSRPSIVNAGILHGTHNPTDEGRWTLSIILKDRFNNDLDFYTALEIFADVLEE